MSVIRGGRTTYGVPIGVLMLEMQVPRVPGDLGNATTFDFPVCYEVIEGASQDRALGGDRDLLDPFIAGARRLEAQGVRAIATSCGFLILFQAEMAAAVRVPVFTSSLLQVPLVSRLLGPGRKVGVLVADDTMIGQAHLEAMGIDDPDTVVLGGLQPIPAFRTTFLGNAPTLDVEAMEAGLVTTAERLVEEHQEVGALVLECANLHPYAPAVQEATGLPVFDIVTLTRWVHQAVVQQRPLGGYM